MLLFMSLAMVLAVPAVALADNAVADGDGLEPVGNNDMAMGSVACGVASQKQAPIAVSRQGSAGSTNVFKNGAKVTVAVQSVTGAGLSAQMGTTPSEITLPSDWGTKGNGTMSASVSSTVTVNSSVAGAGSGSVTYVATGQNSDGATITRTDDMRVAWTTGSCTPADSTAPTSSHDLSSAANDNGWHNQNVTVTLDATDNAGGSGVKEIRYSINGGADAAYNSASKPVISTEGTTTFSYYAVDNNNSEEANSFQIKLDKTAPTIQGAASPAANLFGWNNSSVTVNYSCGDNLSGMASCGPNETLSSEGANQSSTGNATDKAGNSASDTVSGINIDKTNPLVSLIGGPANGSSHYFGSVPNAPTCDASDVLSGLNGACQVSGYGTTVGSHSVKATANDKAGNSNSASNSYTVDPWTFKGFYQPVDMNNVLNTVKGGSTVPLKFELFAGSTELTDTANVVTPLKATKVACDTGASLDDIEMLASGSTALRYDGTAGQYIYNWKTPTGAGTCYNVTIADNDGSSQTAKFKLK